MVVELKVKMRMKTASTHKNVTYGEMEKHEEQIQSLLKNLKTYVNPIHGAATNMATGAEVPLVLSKGYSPQEKKLNNV